MTARRRHPSGDVRRRLITVRAVVIASGGDAVAAAFLVALVVGHLLPVEPVRTPGRADVRSVIWPLFPVLAALAVPVAARSSRRSLDRVAARPAWHGRLALVGVLIARAVALCALSAFDRPLLARNLALFDGLALLGSRLLPDRLAWAPLVLFPVACWLIGVDPPGTVRSWAVPLLPLGHAGAGVVALVVWLAGVLSFLASRPRTG